MKVIDNFLSSQEFKKLSNIVLSDYFPWYFNDNKTYKGDGYYQFTHRLYDGDEKGINSNFYSNFNLILHRLNVHNLGRLKLNLNHKTLFRRKFGWHTDEMVNKNFELTFRKTAIFYFNTNNGFTKIKGYGKIKSVANRMVIFDTNLLHTGFSRTDKKRRIIMNCNFS